MAYDWLTLDNPSRRGIVFGTVGATAAYCFMPKWVPVRYHFDYTTMQQSRVTYNSLRRSSFMMMGGAMAGSLIALATRNPKFD